jgi:hypothetical protein
LKVSVTFFPGLKQNLMQTCCSFKSAIFWLHKNCRWNNMLALNKTLFNNRTCYNHIPSRKWLSRFYCIFPSGRSPCSQQ